MCINKLFICYQPFSFTKITLRNESSVIVSKLPGPILMLMLFDQSGCRCAKVAYCWILGTELWHLYLRANTVWYHFSGALEYSVTNRFTGCHKTSQYTFDIRVILNEFIWLYVICMMAQWYRTMSHICSLIIWGVFSFPSKYLFWAVSSFQGWPEDFHKEKI